MSLQSLTWIFDHSEATGFDRNVELSLANEADSQGRVYWHDLGDIAFGARVSRSSAYRRLNHLEEVGHIVILRSPAPSKHRKNGCNAYVMIMGRNQDEINRLVSDMELMIRDSTIPPREKRLETPTIPNSPPTIPLIGGTTPSSLSELPRTPPSESEIPQSGGENRSTDPNITKKPQREVPASFTVTNHMRSQAKEYGLSDQEINYHTESFRLCEFKGEGRSNFTNAWYRWMRTESEKKKINSNGKSERPLKSGEEIYGRFTGV